jgi:hypothetical protein
MPLNGFHLGAVRRSSYRGRMSILLEAIGAVVQAVIEVAADALFRGREEKQQDNDPGE